MKLLLTTLLTAAISVIAIYRQDNLFEYMRSFLRTSTLNSLSKSVRSTTSVNTTFSAMAPTSTFVGLPVIPPQDPSLNAISPKPRGIQKVFEARKKAEGADATVRRSIGTVALRNFTPFLILDHFSVAPGAGFSDHPHKGQETSTYLLDGAVDHEDFAGNKGTSNAGDLQFMTAGRGIVHAEMPHDDGKGTSNVGMRLCEIPTATADDGKVTFKVISGRSYGVDSVQELAYTPVWLLDVTIQPGGKLTQSLPAMWNSFAYTFEGTTTFDTGATTQQVPQYHNTVFEQKGHQVIAQVPADAKEAARFILLAGLPLDQPVVQYGPFVLNDASLVRHAMMDYSTYTDGFERANGWASEIGKVMM